jgi:hypothetical protein
MTANLSPEAAKAKTFSPRSCRVTQWRTIKRIQAAPPRQANRKAVTVLQFRSANRSIGGFIPTNYTGRKQELPAGLPGWCSAFSLFRENRTGCRESQWPGSRGGIVSTPDGTPRSVRIAAHPPDLSSHGNPPRPLVTTVPEGRQQRSSIAPEPSVSGRISDVVIPEWKPAIHGYLASRILAVAMNQQPFLRAGKRLCEDYRGDAHDKQTRAGSPPWQVDDGEGGYWQHVKEDHHRISKKIQPGEPE